MSNNLVPVTAVPQPLSPASPDFYDRIDSPMDAVKTMGDWIAHSGMFGCVKPEQGYVLALECIASRMTPLSWKRENHLINGNITMKSESMLSGLMNAGWDIDWIQFDTVAAIADFSKGAKKVRVSFTADDAKIAGLIPAKPGSGWAKFPAEMLRARVISKATRMLDPRITQGRFTPEEVADFSATPSAPAPTTPTRQTVNVTPESTFPLTGKQEQILEPHIANAFLVSKNLIKLEQILEPHSDIANAFLLSKNLIKEGQNFRDVSTKVANMIISDADGFISKAKAFSSPTLE
jgi:hypothetical protein